MREGQVPDPHLNTFLTFAGLMASSTVPGSVPRCFVVLLADAIGSAVRPLSLSFPLEMPFMLMMTSWGDPRSCQRLSFFPGK